MNGDKENVQGEKASPQAGKQEADQEVKQEEVVPSVPQSDGILRDPKTGEPLRDQTPPAVDTGYLGNHAMQDATETVPASENVDETDFGDEGDEPA